MSEFWYLFKIKNPENHIPLQFAYLKAILIETGKIFVRKLPIVGLRDWLLIYEDTLVELSVKDAYDELEIVVIQEDITTTLNHIQ